MEIGLQTEVKSNPRPCAQGVPAVILKLNRGKEVALMFLTKLEVVEEFVLGPEINSLEVSGFNGAIRWEPLEAGQARVVAEKSVRGLNETSLRALLQELRVEQRVEGRRLVLTAVRPERIWGMFSSQMRFTILASGEHLQELRARTANGSIRLNVPFRGVLDASTQNGPISMAEVIGRVQARTANGRIEFGRLVLTEPSALLTSNGRIQGQLVLAGDGEYRLRTSNGQIDLRMPRSTKGLLRAITSNGRVECRLGENQLTGRKEVVIRNGDGPHLDITTSNGSISILGY